MRSHLVIFALPLMCLAGPVAPGGKSTNSPSDLAESRIFERVPAQPSPYPLDPGPYEGEFQYVNWDPEADKDILEKVHESFYEAQYMASQALLKLTDDSDKGKTARTRWFGDQPTPEQQDNVFANMYNADAGHASAAVSQMVLDKIDFWPKTDGKPFCEVKENANAYTRKEDGRFHICDRGLDKKLNSEILCDDLDASCSLKMRSLAMVLLHEWTHYDRVGGDALNEMDILDYASGAYDCFKLDDDDKVENAQNYAWFAGEIHWGMYCPKTFEDPEKGIK